MEKGYLIQQGVDGACIYWNAHFESSKILSKDPISEVRAHPFNLRGAKKIKELWDGYANGKATFKIVEIPLD